jgi:hypothetical protein
MHLARMLLRLRHHILIVATLDHDAARTLDDLRHGFLLAGIIVTLISRTLCKP